jgi:hypothetical protein
MRNVAAVVVGYYEGSFRTFLRVEVVNNASKYGKWPHLLSVDDVKGGAA